MAGTVAQGVDPAHSSIAEFRAEMMCLLCAEHQAEAANSRCAEHQAEAANSRCAEHQPERVYLPLAELQSGDGVEIPSASHAFQVLMIRCDSDHSCVVRAVDR